MLWCGRRNKHDGFQSLLKSKKELPGQLLFACHQNSVKYSDPSFPLASTV